MKISKNLYAVYCALRTKDRPYYSLIFQRALFPRSSISDSSLKVENVSHRISFWGERLLTIELSGSLTKQTGSKVEFSVNKLAKQCAEILINKKNYPEKYDERRGIGDFLFRIQNICKNINTELNRSSKVAPLIHRIKSLIHRIIVNIRDFFFPLSKYLDSNRYMAPRVKYLGEKENRILMEIKGDGTRMAILGDKRVEVVSLSDDERLKAVSRALIIDDGSISEKLTNNSKAIKDGIEVEIADGKRLRKISEGDEKRLAIVLNSGEQVIIAKLIEEMAEPTAG